MQCQHCCWFICYISGLFSRPQAPVRTFLTDLHGPGHWGQKWPHNWPQPAGCLVSYAVKIFRKSCWSGGEEWSEVQPMLTVSLFTQSNCSCPSGWDFLPLSLIRSSLCKESLFGQPAVIFFCYISTNSSQLSPILHLACALQTMPAAKFLFLSHPL